MPLKIDMVGKKFGRLTVTKLSKKRSNDGHLMYYCDCDCGTKNVKIMGKSLRNGATQSCGCLQKERASIANKKYNKYDLSGEYGIGWTSNTNKEFYFDLEDYNKIKDYCWLENNNGYIITSIPNTNKMIFMHNLIMDTYEIDHVKHNVKDNRKSQLRIATRELNCRNQAKRSNNTSGYTGVYWSNRDECWYACIVVGGEKKYLGIFNNLQDAVKARREAEEQYFGEWSYKNSVEHYNNEIENRCSE